MVTQKEIADKLKISRTTVARALMENSSIKAETRDKVLSLAKKLGYKKNIIGSSLASKNVKKVFAFIVKSVNENYSLEIKEGLIDISEELSSYNFELNIIETDILKPDNQLTKLKEILDSEKPDGIIIVPLLKNDIKKIVTKYKTTKFISLDVKLSPDIFHIGGDYFKSGKISANILNSIMRNKEKVLIFDTGDDNISSNSYLEGFCKSIDRKKIITIGPVYVENILKNFENILATYITDDISAVYSNRYLSEISKLLNEKLPKHNFSIVVNGMSSLIKDLIKCNIITATVKEKHYDQGYFAGKYMFNYLYETNTTDIKEHIIDSEIIFKENLK